MRQTRPRHSVPTPSGRPSKEQACQRTEERRDLLITYTTGIDKYSIVAVDADGLALVRLLGGRRSITREEVDEDPMEQYIEAQAALARASPRKAGKSAKSPYAEKAREHFLKQRQANSPARRRKAEARAAWQASLKVFI